MPIPPSPSEARYGEPWDSNGETIWNASNVEIFDPGWDGKSEDAFVNRAVECVNACKGIADPAKTLSEVKKLLGVVNTYLFATRCSLENEKVSQSLSIHIDEILTQLSPAP